MNILMYLEADRTTDLFLWVHCCSVDKLCPAFSDPVDYVLHYITSLRVYNTLDANVVINFYEDATNGMGYWLADKDNSAVGITLAHGNYYMAITPDDIPQLNYLSKIKLRVAAATTPTEGSITIYVVSKR